MQKGKLFGLTALITASGQGIGEAIAKTLAREGALTVISDINLTEANRVGAEIEAYGGLTLVLQADVTRFQEVHSMVKTVLDKFGTIDILVNVAGGFNRFASILDISEDEWDRVISLNLKSTFLCSQAVARIMMEKKKGRIINIASQGGVGPNPYAPSYIPYGAAKAGVIGFTKHLAKALGPYGITVNAVSPGTALTPRVKKVRDSESLNKIASMNPMKHLIEPQDCAEAVLFLASNESRYVTGINLIVNAGTLIV